MYTVPVPAPSLKVYFAEFPNVPLPVKRLQYEAATRFTNPGRTFRCADISSASLRRFFGENGSLIGRKLLFVYTERRFVHAPPFIEKQTQGVVEVNWLDGRRLTYISRFCGRERTGSVVLS
ncbi:hypothetical protein [Taklimakanibacter deserti]|uniref:hypothetical protein n=1 Tax=Taklimakanibacter deserti TaxID=2267839 RepID=UPI000E64F6AD